MKWKHLTVCQKKMSSSLFKNVIFKVCLEIIYLKYVWKGFGIKWPVMVDMP